MRHLMRSSALVANYFDTLTPQQAATARTISQVIKAAAPELTQAVKWGNLNFMLDGRNVLSIVAHKAHIQLQVFSGALLMDRFPQLEGQGRGVRFVKLRCSQPVDVELVEDLTLAALVLAQNMDRAARDDADDDIDL